MDLYPLVFQPVFRSYLWGGTRLRKILGKPVGELPEVAESWEVVDHGSDQSLVAQGALAGKSLHWIVEHHGEELFGAQANLHGSFPLLLKYLDCNRVLSVQVHPNDEYARRMARPDLGKTEAWYVISAEPGSVIYAGLRAGVDREMFSSAIRTGRVVDVLNTIPAEAGQCIFIPAGTVHALGAGILCAEIQQSSDTTFRVYDWDRVDHSGLPRPLHVEQALEVTDYSSGPIVPARPVPLADGGERLVNCDRFVLDRYEVQQPIHLQQNTFRILTVIRGGGTLVSEHGEVPMPLGSSTLIPASVGAVDWIPLGDGATVLSMMGPQV